MPMPFISDAIKQMLDAHRAEPATAAELNYKITQVCKEYIEVHGGRYLTFNEVIGVLSCVTQELYRQQVAPFENSELERVV